MTAEQKLILALLSEELFGENGAEASETDCDWPMLMSEAKKHGVMTLLLKGLTLHETEYAVPAGYVKKLKSVAVSAMVRGERLLDVQRDAVSRLKNAGIPCAVLKGAGIAEYYPHPELRVLGDVDILVPRGRSDEAVTLLEKNGYDKFEHEHDFHTVLHCGAVSVEIHRAVSVFPDNECGRYAEALFDNALETTDSFSVGERCFPVLTAKYQLLSLLFHTERHMLTSSVGLRQLCDWAAAANALSGSLSEEDIADFERCGMKKFACALCGTCGIFLGMPQTSAFPPPEKKLCVRMMNELLGGGNFSAQSDERAISSSFVEPTSGIGKKRSGAGVFIAKINAKARERYPITRKLPILLPFFWLFIPLKSFFGLRRSRKNSPRVGTVLSFAAKRNRLYRELRLFEKD